MAAERIRFGEAGLPLFAVPKAAPGEAAASPFELSSHARAREALAFGLAVADEGFNIFVVGEGRSGRMTSTRAYLESHFEIEKRIRHDWVYVNNFRRAHAPRPIRLPRGLGITLQQHMPHAIEALQLAIVRALEEGVYLERQATREPGESERRRIAAEVVASWSEDLARRFEGSDELIAWFAEIREDVLQHLDHLVAIASGDPVALATKLASAQARYAVNLIVDNADEAATPVVVEANPSYENLFGRIEYRSERGVLMTDFSMIRGGALHRANGGVLIVRADALGKNPESWEFLKSALRDKEIRIEERHKSGAAPLTAAPTPLPIPLDVKLVLIGSHEWYYRLLKEDPDFADYFKVKAEIDTTMDANACNLAVFTKLIRQASLSRSGVRCDDAGVAALLAQLSRWAGDRGKLAASFELIDDLLVEAATRLPRRGARVISARHVKAAVIERRRRNSAFEDRSQEMIASGLIHICTRGTAVGQINGLTVRRAGNHVFGQPARVTARTYVGGQGVVNIDRLTGHGGPIQQKGMFIIGGFLHGLFSTRFPISFSGTVTFEQTYTGVEGDSASLAELCALLSSLAELPVRQDLAITGSVNQVGEAQAISDLHHKIEGFFHTCRRSGLTGTQGVIFPEANCVHLVLRDEVADALKKKRFHLWSVANVDEAVELFTGVRAGRTRRRGGFSPDSVYDRVARKLQSYDQILSERSGRGNG